MLGELQPSVDGGQLICNIVCATRIYCTERKLRLTQAESSVCRVCCVWHWQSCFDGVPGAVLSFLDGCSVIVEAWVSSHCRNYTSWRLTCRHACGAAPHWLLFPSCCGSSSHGGGGPSTRVSTHKCCVVLETCVQCKSSPCIEPLLALQLVQYRQAAGAAPQVQQCCTGCTVLSGSCGLPQVYSMWRHL